MNHRSRILDTIRNLKLEERPLPDLDTLPVIPAKEEALPWDQFVATLETVGGQATELASNESLQRLLETRFPEAQYIGSTLPDVAGTVDLDETQDPHDLSLLDVAVVRAEFGVVENGAVWIDQASLRHRVLPFIAQHLMIVLRKRELLANLHQAYARIQRLDGYGLFISGPSKTADIEQSLVIGAHGARSLLVVGV